MDTNNIQQSEMDLYNSWNISNNSYICNVVLWYRNVSCGLEISQWEAFP